MTAPTDLQAFIAKWRDNARRERASSQEHFLDLCRLTGTPTPNEADPTGAEYTFEAGAGKTSGGTGWADVWRRGYFGWEYKGAGRALDAAAWSAYGWPSGVGEEEALERLLALNLERGDLTP